MTLNEMMEELKNMPSEAALVFVSDAGDIGAGFHVTELKHAEVTGIDCGAQISTWREASLQLLDGSGRSHMKVGKFAGILRQSLKRLVPLADVPLHVEFAPQNNGLRKYHVSQPTMSNNRVVIALSDDRAFCKPAQKAKTFGTPTATSACCSSNVGASACCV